MGNNVVSKKIFLSDQCFLKLIGKHLLDISCNEHAEEKLLNAFIKLSVHQYFVDRELLRKIIKKQIKPVKIF